jgi:uncharacterized protein (TIGR03435 family)
MIRLLGACLLALLPSAALGQSAHPPRKFEVAAIKTLDPPYHRLFDYSASGTRLTLEGYAPIHLIMEAYNLKAYQVSFGPAASPPDYTYYFIEAKAEGDSVPTRDEFRRMLQTLLAERFSLKVHRDKKDMDVYALVVGRTGPKFKESAPDADPIAYHGVNGRNQTVTAARYTMEQLADSVGNVNGRPIVDRTGLTGTYNIKMEATPEFRIDNNPQPEDISIFAAVQDQLGLKLEPQKAPIDILVVDHIEKPSAN